MALTDTSIRTAKPAAKPARIFDGHGLYIEISPSGGKLWRLKYRFGGKEKLLALGKYPEVSLKDAREHRDAARKLLANEVDPAENRKASVGAGVLHSTRVFRPAQKNSLTRLPVEFFARLDAGFFMLWATGQQVQPANGYKSYLC